MCMVTYDVFTLFMRLIEMCVLGECSGECVARDGNQCLECLQNSSYTCAHCQALYCPQCPSYCTNCEADIGNIIMHVCARALLHSLNTNALSNYVCMYVR
jgi:hypothetical protein